MWEPIVPSHMEPAFRTKMRGLSVGERACSDAFVVVVVEVSVDGSGPYLVDTRNLYHLQQQMVNDRLRNGRTR